MNEINTVKHLLEEITEYNKKIEVDKVENTKIYFQNLIDINYDKIHKILNKLRGKKYLQDSRESVYTDAINVIEDLLDEAGRNLEDSVKLIIKQRKAQILINEEVNQQTIKLEKTRTNVEILFDNTKETLIRFNNAILTQSKFNLYFVIGLEALAVLVLILI